MPRLRGGADRARSEVGFTVMSISMSLIAVFIPILLMGGIVGRLFREFAMTLSIAILISLAVSLTTTPMMCALLLRPKPRRQHGRLHAAANAASTACCAATSARCAGRCDHPRLVMLVLLATVGAQRLPVHDHAEGLFPAAGHRPPDRRHPGRPEHLVPGDAAEADAVHRHRAATIRRWTAWSASPAAAAARDQQRLRVRRAEAAGRAQHVGRPGDPPAARASWPRCRARGCSCRRCRTSASAGGRATRSISTPCRPTSRRTVRVGAADCWPR